MITKEQTKNILYDVYCEFENEIDTYETSSGRELTNDDLDIMFEFLQCYVDKVKLLIDDYESEEV